MTRRIDSIAKSVLSTSLAALLTLGALTSWPVAAKAAASGSIKGKVVAMSYNMRLRLDDKKDRLYERVYMRVKNQTNKAVKTIYLKDMTNPATKYARKNHASEGNKKKSSKLYSIKYKGPNGKTYSRPLKYKRTKEGSTLRVNLPKGRSIAPGKTATIAVRLRTDIPSRQDRFSVTKTKKGKLYLLSFCFPYLADNNNGRWVKDPFFDDGESRSYSLANYKVRFEAPAKYKVAATGSESSRIVTRKVNDSKSGSAKAAKTRKVRVTTINAKNYRDFAVCCSDFMAKDTFKVGDMTVNNWYLKGKYSKLYRKVTKMIAMDSLKAYSDTIGTIPIKEMDVLQCLFGFAFGGMEYPGLLMVNGSQFFDGASDMYACVDVQEAYAHELCHMWFYSTVGNREYRAGWIDESFTTFVTTELYLMKHSASVDFITKRDDLKPVEEARSDRAELLADEMKERGKRYVNIPPNKYPRSRTYADFEYTVGDLFLLAVKQEMGEEAFWAFVRDYYNTYYNKVATTGKVVALMRKHAASCGKLDAVNKILNRYISPKYL